MDLFGRAKKAMGGFAAPPPSQPQYFRILCPEGHPVEGRRNDGYQAVRCPDCGEGVFVLPASPFPEPKPPANRAARPVKAQAVDYDAPIPLVDAEPIPVARGGGEAAETVEWEDEVEEGEDLSPVADEGEPPPHDPGAPIVNFDADLYIEEQAPQASASTAPKPAKPRPRRTTPVVPDVPPPEPLGARVWRMRNLILVLLVIAVVGAAVGSRLRRRRLAELPQVYERGKSEGLEALDRGDFIAAKELLRAAASAIRDLGGSPDDPDVKAVVEGAEEAAIYADLVRVSLDDLVEKRARAKTPKDWDGEFDTYFKGQSVVLLAHVTDVPDPARADSGYEIDYRIGFGGGSNPTGKGRVDLRGFRLLEAARPSKGDAVTFGARLAGVDFDAARGEYLVKFEPDSGVFLRRAAALAALEVGPREEEEP